jgi:prevent-host-death family protein
VGRLSAPAVDCQRGATLDNNCDQSYYQAMKTIPAAQFKAQCLSLLDRVDPDGILITKHGKPVARLLPVTAESASLIGKFKGKIRIKGRILSTGLRWDAES